jgi:hypothetical protein
VLRNKRGQLRHALSEVLPTEDPRRHSHTMTEAKEYAFSRLQQELNIAQSVSQFHSFTQVLDLSYFIVAFLQIYASNLY